MTFKSDLLQAVDWVNIIKTHTESYESGFSDGLERAFDIIQDIIEEYLGGDN